MKCLVPSNYYILRSYYVPKKHVGLSPILSSIIPTFNIGSIIPILEIFKKTEI